MQAAACACGPLGAEKRRHFGGPIRARALLFGPRMNDSKLCEVVTRQKAQLMSALVTAGIFVSGSGLVIVALLRDLLIA